MMTVQFVDNPPTTPSLAYPPFHLTHSGHNHFRSLPLFVRNDKITLKPPPSGKQQPENQASPTTHRCIPAPNQHPSPIGGTFAHQRRSSTHIRPATTVCRLSLTAAQTYGQPTQYVYPKPRVSRRSRRFNLFFSLDSDDTFTITITATPMTADHRALGALDQVQYGTHLIESTMPLPLPRKPPSPPRHVQLEPHVHVCRRLNEPWSYFVPTQCRLSCGGCLSRGFSMFQFPRSSKTTWTASISQPWDLLRGSSISVVSQL